MSDYREDWTEVGREEWEGVQDRIRAAAAAMEWRPLPIEDAPAMPGLGIMAAIEQLRLPKVSRVAWSSELAPYGLYGIEANYSNGRVQVFIVDRGTDLVPVVSYFWAKATEGATA
jgi:hypothetical protein